MLNDLPAKTRLPDTYVSLWKHLLQLLLHVVRLQSSGYDATTGIDDDIVGYGQHAELLEERAFEGLLVANRGPGQRVAVEEVATFAPRAVCADADDIQS